jgi:8-oxo-dGTP pyrophosphatase MutT (NUDIX family)
MDTRQGEFCVSCGKPVNGAAARVVVEPLCETCSHSIHQAHPKLCVAVLLPVENQGLLAIRRTHDPHKGAWAFPSGRMKLRETPEAAASRELAEETGVLRPASAMRRFGWVSNDIGAFIIFMLARPPLLADELPRFHESGEVDGVKIVTPSATMGFAADREILGKYFAKYHPLSSR